MSKIISAEEALKKQETENTIKNYTRVANMLVDGYQDLLAQEKWLYICLTRLCGKEGNRFLSLRYIAERTGFSLGALSASKKTGSPGMLWRLHNTGLIHAEIKKQIRADGKETKNAQFHITITDVWQKNFDFFYGPSCSDSEHLSEQGKLSVRNSNASCSNSERVQGQPVQFPNATCSEIGTNIRLQGKITNSSKITVEEAFTISPIQETAAALNTFSFETITEEEIALVQAYRQGSLKETLPPSQNLGAARQSRRVSK